MGFQTDGLSLTILPSGFIYLSGQCRGDGLILAIHWNYSIKLVPSADKYKFTRINTVERPSHLTSEITYC